MAETAQLPEEPKDASTPKTPEAGELAQQNVQKLIDHSVVLEQLEARNRVFKPKSVK